MGSAVDDNFGKMMMSGLLILSAGSFEKYAGRKFKVREFK